MMPCRPHSGYGWPMTTRRGLGSALVALRAHPLVADVILATVLVVLGWLQLVSEGLTPGALAGMVAMTAPVATRRIAPLASVAVGWVALLVQEGLGADVTSQGYAAVIALVITVYSVAAHCARRRAIAGIVIALSCVWISIPFGAEGLDAQLPSYAFTGLVAGAPWAVGRMIRGRQERIDELRELSRTLQLEREERSRQAVLAERDRMAREMHDVLSHTVSVMVVQLGGVQAIIDTDRDTARSVIESVRTMGKAALTELRFLLGLHAGSPDALAGSNPGLGRLAELVAQMRDAGLPVTVDAVGDISRLPPAVDLAAYRIVQESLTNTLKHAPGADAFVHIEVGEERIDLRIQNTNSPETASRGPLRTGPGRPGHGINGMRERARLCGGELVAGPDADRGFTVSAHLPLGVVG